MPKKKHFVDQYTTVQSTNQAKIESYVRSKAKKYVIRGHLVPQHGDPRGSGLCPTGAWGLPYFVAEGQHRVFLMFSKVSLTCLLPCFLLGVLSCTPSTATTSFTSYSVISYAPGISLGTQKVVVS